MNTVIGKPARPVYKRQRFLLSFIKELNESCSSVELQKLLFLYQIQNNLCHYTFVPYRFGGFSIQAAADIDTLQSRGWLAEIGRTIQYVGPAESGEEDLLPFGVGFPPAKQLPIARGDELIRTVYKKYPYYAINSTIAASLLDEKDLARIQTERDRFKRQTGRVLFTIGYEGRSLEDYLNLLIQNNITVLCDVRNNPISRKFGFSRNSLQKHLPVIGIDYVHIPQLGIISEKRTNLSGEEDYRQLFQEYGDSLANRKPALAQVQGLLTTRNRVALTCFEREPGHCHRHIIRDYFKNVCQIETMDL